jgi:hypothetical protein
MGANKSSNANFRYFKLIGKAENANQLERTAIVEVVKTANGYEKDGWFSSLSGYLTHMEIKEFMYDNKKKEKIIIHLQDNNVDVMQLEMTFNNVVFGLLNSLIDADFEKEIQIDAYINKKGYVAAGVKYTNASEWIKWKYQLNELPQVKKIELSNGDTVIDNGELVAFWKNKVIDMKSKAVKSNFTMRVGDVKHVEVVNNFIDPIIPKQHEGGKSFDEFINETDDLPF